MLETFDLSRSYGDKLVVDRLNLKVEGGSMLALLGPNGAGKSTTMRVLSSTILPTSGSYMVGGHPGRTLAARQMTGYVPDTRGLFPRLNAREHLELAGRLAGSGDFKSRLRELSQLLDLDALGKAPASTFSHGQSRRVSMAMALVSRPALLLVDEPFDGVDPLGVDVIKELLIGARNEGAATVLTTHLLDAAVIADQVAVFCGSQLKGPFPTAELLSEYGSLKQAWVALASEDSRT